MRRRIAVIGENASPMANPGGVEGGAQNVYAAHIFENLSRLGYEVDLFTRGDSAALPEIHEQMQGVRVIHVPAGAAEPGQKEDTPRHMGAFTAYLLQFFEKQDRPYDLMHANSWMSGLAAATVKQATAIPFVITLHALDPVRPGEAEDADPFPGERFEMERRIVQEADGIVVETPQVKSDLIEHYNASHARILEIPSDPDAREMRPVDEPFTGSKVSRMMADFYEQVIEQRQRDQPAETLAAPEYADAEIREEMQIISQSFDAAREMLERSRERLDRGILRAFDLIIGCLARGSKVMVCGNGGSAAHAQHFAAELVGRFVSGDRRGLPVMALTADTAFLTAWSNQVGYEKVFSRQIEALARPGDLLVGISTTGRSRSLVDAFSVARQMGMESLALLGGDGGEVAFLSDAALVAPSWNTQRIQEVHLLILHLLSELVERHIHSTTWAYRNNSIWSVSAAGRDK